MNRALLCPWVLAACGGCSTSNAKTDGDADAALARCLDRVEVYEAALYDCCAGFTQDEIEERVNARKEACTEITGHPERGWDPDADDTCHALVSDAFADCAPPELTGAACYGLYPGLGDPGEYCLSSSECSAGLYCDVCQGSDDCSGGGACAPSDGPDAPPAPCDDVVACANRPLCE